MHDTKTLRASVRSKILSAVPSWDVSHAINKSGADSYVVFMLNDVISYDERQQIDLEVNIIAPMSREDAAEAASDAIIAALDRAVVINPGTIYYLYKSTRSRVDGSDPHTVRYRLTFDMYLYERND